jgi:hypothetical protein
MSLAAQRLAPACSERRRCKTFLYRGAARKRPAGEAYYSSPLRARTGQPRQIHAAAQSKHMLAALLEHEGPRHGAGYTQPAQIKTQSQRHSQPPFLHLIVMSALSFRHISSTPCSSA